MEIIRELGERLKEWLERISGWIGSTIGFLLRLVAVVLLFALGLELFQAWRPNIWPLKTYGEILVDSPEVYTRERLVNDRYDQHFWLREQLDNIDTANLISKRIEQSSSFTGGTDAAGEGADANAEKAPEELDFGQDLALRLARRDVVRQLIVENMLDDRHDLTGNTVFGLKFDTTVVPGRNTHNPAAVVVELMPPARMTNAEFYEPFYDRPEIDPSLDWYQQIWLSEQGYFPAKPRDVQIFEEYRYRYRQWLQSVQERLNEYVIGVGPGAVVSRQACDAETFPSSPEARTEMDRITERALEVTLATGQTRLVYDESRRVEQRVVEEAIPLLPPWDKQFALFRWNQQIGECRFRPQFKVVPLRDAILEVEVPEGAAATRLAAPFDKMRLYQPGSEPGTNWFVASDIYGQAVRPRIDIDQEPKFQALVRSILSQRDASGDYALRRSAFCTGNQIPNPAAGGEDEPDTLDLCYQIRTAFVPTGMFNFMEKIQQTDSYSYALFPRFDGNAQVRDATFKAGLGGADGLDIPIGAALRRRIAGTEVSASLTGFGASTDPRAENVTFGWILRPPSNGDPVSRSQMALVSIPAWTQRLKVKVRTGWLDRNGHIRIDTDTNGESKTLEVPLPPDYEAIDGLISSSEVSGMAYRQPQIVEQRVSTFRLRTCREASLLIPGARLWRSTEVTVAGQRADRIMVLPNMKGIVASFDQVKPPNTFASEVDLPGQPGRKRWITDVTVWTSEGVATLPGRVMIEGREAACAAPGSTENPLVQMPPEPPQN